MRLETGSNIDSGYKKVSIQVKLGGLSFSASKVCASDAKQLLFVIDTPRKRSRVATPGRQRVPPERADRMQRIAGRHCSHYSHRQGGSRIDNRALGVTSVIHLATPRHESQRGGLPLHQRKREGVLYAPIWRRNEATACRSTRGNNT